MNEPMEKPDFTGVVGSVSAGFPANIGPGPSPCLITFRLDHADPPIPRKADSVFYIDLAGGRGAWAAAAIVFMAFQSGRRIAVKQVEGEKQLVAWVQCERHD